MRTCTKTAPRPKYFWIHVEQVLDIFAIFPNNFYRCHLPTGTSQTPSSRWKRSKHIASPHYSEASLPESSMTWSQGWKPFKIPSFFGVLRIEVLIRFSQTFSNFDQKWSKSFEFWNCQDTHFGNVFYPTWSIIWQYVQIPHLSLSDTVQICKCFCISGPTDSWHPNPYSYCRTCNFASKNQDFWSFC